MKWKILVRCSVGVAACGYFVAGCSKSSPPVSPSRPPSTSALVSKAQPGSAGGTLTLAVPGSPRTFNPIFAFDSASDAVTRLLFSPLVVLDMSDQEIGPGLAESSTVADDQRTWKFRLRAGLFWSDGQPLTADDVVFTWNDVIYQEAVVGPDFNRIVSELFRVGGTNFSVSRLDPLTVQVITPVVYAPFLEFFGGVAILPKHSLENAVRARRFNTAFSASTPARQLVASGPFRVKTHLAGKETILERNPEYWVVNTNRQRLPYFEQVRFIAAGAPGADSLLFLRGLCDLAEHLRPEDRDQFARAEATNLCKVYDLGPGMDRELLWFNLNTGTNKAGQPFVTPARAKWFSDRRFRQAISCAMDRERIVREVYGGAATSNAAFVASENQRWNNPNVPRYDYNLERARSLLAEMGIKERDNKGGATDEAGNAVEFTLSSNRNNPGREKVASALAEDLKKLGIVMRIELLDFRDLLVKVNETFTFEAALMGLGGGGLDPATHRNVLRSDSELHQWHPLQPAPATDWEARIDRLMEEQMHTLDFAARKKIFDEVQTILAEELPMIPTVAPHRFAACKPTLSNVRPSILSPYALTWNMEELYWKR